MAFGNTGNPAGENIHRADEFGDLAAIRILIERFRRIDLQHPALGHDGDAVRQGERFFLVMGDEHKGDADGSLQGAQFDLHFLAQVLVEGAKRFIKQEHFRPADKGAGQRHALPLPAGKLMGGALAVARQA